VRVEKSGYQVSPTQRIRLAEGGSREVRFNLVPERVAEFKPPAPAAGQVQPKSAPEALPLPPPVNPTPQPQVPPAVQTATLPPPPPDPEARDWDLVKDTADPARLQVFLEKHANGPHAPQAREHYDELSWKRTNPNDLASLQKYTDQFPQGKHVADAAEQLTKIRAQLEKQKQQADQDNQERTAILSTLNSFNAAFQRRQPRELRQVWPQAKKEYTDALSLPGKYLMELACPSGNIAIMGENAAAVCGLSSSYNNGPSQTNSERVTLHKEAGRWLIVSIQKL
jgi:hypothetical protein